MSEDRENPLVYGVRLSEAAVRQVEDTWLRLAETTDAVTADAWRGGLREALASLASLPERCPIAPEDELYGVGTLRQLVYRRRRGGPAWRIRFSIRSADANDPPTVRVHQVRHGAQAPLTEWPLEDEEP